MGSWMIRVWSLVLLGSIAAGLSAPAMADGLIRLEPYSGGPTTAPTTVPNFYSDPYTASLLNGGSSQPPATVIPAATASGQLPLGQGGPATPAATNGYTQLQPTSPTNPSAYTPGLYNSATYPAANPYNPSNPVDPATNLYSGSYGQSAPLSGRVSYIPAGESFTIRLNQIASTQTSRLGDPVSATLDAPIVVNGVEAVPAGSAVDGTITAISSATRVGKHGEMELRFLTLTKPNGEKVSIDGSVVTTNGTPVLKGDTYTLDVLKGAGIVVGGTVLGAVGGTAVGGIVGAAGAGAALGTAVGAAAGIGLAIARKGKSVDLPQGTRLRIKLDQPATITSSTTY